MHSAPQAMAAAPQQRVSRAIPPTAHCLNCEVPMHGAFCAACGQHDVDLGASTWHVVREALADAVDLDGRMLRTLRALFSPGHLTLEYLRGRRVPFVSPLKLVLLAGTVLSTTWIVTRGVDSHFYGLASDRSAARYIDAVVRGAMASGVAIAVGGWALAGGRRRLLDEAVFALHLVSALALWTAAVIWFGTAWKLTWGMAAAVPKGVPSLPVLVFLPASLVGLAYIVAAVNRVQGGRWWVVALRSAVITIVGVGAVLAIISHDA